MFVHNSGVTDRFRKRLTTRVLEIGLGTGLNFLLTADAARRFGADLQYTGIDPRLPAAATVRELGYQAFLEDPALIDGWMNVLGNGAADSESYQLAETVTLTLIRQPAEDVMTAWLCPPAYQYDCIYHDAFSPEAAPALWTGEFMGRLFSLLRPNGTLVTYCVKSSLQKTLKSVGFDVTTLAGPEGGKRQVLIARRHNG